MWMCFYFKCTPKGDMLSIVMTHNDSFTLNATMFGNKQMLHLHKIENMPQTIVEDINTMENHTSNGEMWLHVWRNIETITNFI